MELSYFQMPALMYWTRAVGERVERRVMATGEGVRVVQVMIRFLTWERAGRVRVGVSRSHC